MAVDITKVKMGPCSVSLDGTEAGHTQGGVTVEYAPIYHDMVVDKYGQTVIEKILIGEGLKVTVPLAEATLANLEIGIPAGTDVTSQRVTIGKDAGERMAQYAKELVLHPLENDSDDLSEDVVLHQALVSEPFEFKFGNDGEKILEVVFQAILDESKDSGNRLGFIGDSID